MWYSAIHKQFARSLFGYRSASRALCFACATICVSADVSASPDAMGVVSARSDKSDSEATSSSKAAMTNLPDFPVVPQAQFDGPEPPFSSQELWKRLRAMMISYEGNVTPADVERVFGVSLVKTYYTNVSGYYYSRRAPPTAWYDLIAIMFLPPVSNSTFSFAWKYNRFMAGDRLTKRQVMVGVSNTKWKLVSELNDHGIQRDTYRYCDYIANIDMTADMVHTISFGAVIDRTNTCAK